MVKRLIVIFVFLLGFSSFFSVTGLADGHQDNYNEYLYYNPYGETIVVFINNFQHQYTFAAADDYIKVHPGETKTFSLATGSYEYVADVQHVGSFRDEMDVVEGDTWVFELTSEAEWIITNVTPRRYLEKGQGHYGGQMMDVSYDDHGHDGKMVGGDYDGHSGYDDYTSGPLAITFNEYAPEPSFARFYVENNYDMEFFIEFGAQALWTDKSPFFWTIPAHTKWYIQVVPGEHVYSISNHAGDGGNAQIVLGQDEAWELRLYPGNQSVLSQVYEGSVIYVNSDNFGHLDPYEGTHAHYDPFKTNMLQGHQHAIAPADQDSYYDYAGYEHDYVADYRSLVPVRTEGFYIPQHAADSRHVNFSFAPISGGYQAYDVLEAPDDFARAVVVYEAVDQDPTTVGGNIEVIADFSPLYGRIFDRSITVNNGQRVPQDLHPAAYVYSLADLYGKFVLGFGEAYLFLLDKSQNLRHGEVVDPIDRSGLVHKW